ncbi:hypothetical protein DXG03_001369 [Asterophora parasitica]|uniref:F-box domain-containing protein n=1 Tax=Asterophora parasitica TaxID=117018 RepID=A0A9P7G5K3_9AGAR|nr:hypothetical protein DXG03_001369 [Asterophora parasitica]
MDSELEAPRLRFPQELINHIIADVGDRKALLQCSLVAPSFREPALKELLRVLEVDCTSLPRVRKLFTLIPHAASFVRSLKYTLSEVMLTETGIACAATVFNELQFVQAVTLKAGRGFRSIPDTLLDAAFRIIHLHSYHNLRLEGFGFRAKDLESSSHLRRLELLEAYEIKLIPGEDLSTTTAGSPDIMRIRSSSAKPSIFDVSIGLQPAESQEHELDIPIGTFEGLQKMGMSECLQRHDMRFTNNNLAHTEHLQFSHTNHNILRHITVGPIAWGIPLQVQRICDGFESITIQNQLAEVTLQLYPGVTIRSNGRGDAYREHWKRIDMLLMRKRHSDMLKRVSVHIVRCRGSRRIPRVAKFMETLLPQLYASGIFVQNALTM